MTSSPWAFVVLGICVTGWLTFEPETLDWYGLATVAIWAMPHFTQRAEHRDTQALQAKLDEQEPEEIEKERERKQAANRLQGNDGSA